MRSATTMMKEPKKGNAAKMMRAVFTPRKSTISPPIMGEKIFGKA